MRIIADLHMHTSASKDGAIRADRLIEHAKKAGLNCIAITDHNTMDAALSLSSTDGFRIIPGEEVKSSAGEIIGYFLKEPIPKGLPPLEVVERIKAQGGLVCVPHPFDRLRKSVIQREALNEILPLVDIIEVLNARVILRSDNQRARRCAAMRGLAMSAGSDAHVARELGQARVEMDDFVDAATFLESLRKARVVGGVSSPLVHFASSWTKVKRGMGTRG